MEVQASLSFECASELSDEELGKISSQLSRVQDDSLKIQSEKGIGGLEIVVYMITILSPFIHKVGEKVVEKLAERAADKIIDSTKDIISSIRSSGVKTIPQNVTLNAAWDGGEVKILLSCDGDMEKQLQARLEALSKLMSTF